MTSPMASHSGLLESGPSQVFCYGTTHCPAPEVVHATQVLQNLEPRVQEGLVAVTLNHAQLNVVLRQLIFVIQSQIRVTEMYTAQWKTAVADLNGRCDALQAEADGIKEVIPRALAELKAEVSAVVDQAIRQSETRIEEEIEEVIADINHALDETNQNVAHEMRRMAAAYCVVHNASAPQREGPEAGGHAPAGPDMPRSPSEQAGPRREVAHVPGRRDRESGAGPVPAPAPAPTSAGTTGEARPEGQSLMVPATGTAVEAHVGGSRAPVAAAQRLALPEASEPPASRSFVSQLRAARASRPAGVTYGPHDIVPNLAEKADVAWVDQQLKGKVDVPAFEAQGNSIDELYQIATNLSSTLERLAATVTAATDGRLLQDAFELRVENLTNELLRLDKVKADRADLPRWLERALADAALATNPCLSCSRTTDAARLTSNRRAQGFPPSTMFLSSLQVTGAAAGASGDPSQGRKAQHPVPNVNSRARKKLSHLQNWLHTRAEEVSQQHLVALAGQRSQPPGPGPGSPPDDIDLPPPVEADPPSIPLTRNFGSIGRWVKSSDGDSVAPSSPTLEPRSGDAEDDGPLGAWDTSTAPDSAGHALAPAVTTPPAPAATRPRRRVPTLTLKG